MAQDGGSETVDLKALIIRVLWDELADFIRRYGLRLTEELEDIAEYSFRPISLDSFGPASEHPKPKDYCRMTLTDRIKIINGVQSPEDAERWMDHIDQFYRAWGQNLDIYTHLEQVDTQNLPAITFGQLIYFLPYMSRFFTNQKKRMTEEVAKDIGHFLKIIVSEYSRLLDAETVSHDSDRDGYQNILLALNYFLVRCVHNYDMKPCCIRSLLNYMVQLTRGTSTIVYRVIDCPCESPTCYVPEKHLLYTIEDLGLDGDGIRIGGMDYSGIPPAASYRHPAFVRTSFPTRELHIGKRRTDIL